MKRLLGLLALAAMTLALVPDAGRAEGRVAFQGVLTAAFAATPNPGTNFCGGPTGLLFQAEAHGVGTTTLGFFSLDIQKTLSIPEPMHGCAKLKATNGDTLNATYDGTVAMPGANLFSVANGTLTFTGGTGRFRGAGGSAKFTATFSPVELASYLVDGSVTLPGND